MSEFERNASYVQACLERLRNNKKSILSASAQALKATDFILNIKFGEKEAVEQKEITALKTIS